MSIRTDFPKGTVVSWRDTQDRRMGTVIGYDVINV